jgi:hypothetical protein
VVESIFPIGELMFPGVGIEPESCDPLISAGRGCNDLMTLVSWNTLVRGQKVKHGQRCRQSPCPSRIHEAHQKACQCKRGDKEVGLGVFVSANSTLQPFCLQLLTTHQIDARSA